jgi:hypothetical protein
MAAIGPTEAEEFENRVLVLSEMDPVAVHAQDTRDGMELPEDNVDIRSLEYALKEDAVATTAGTLWDEFYARIRTVSAIYSSRIRGESHP